MIVNPIIPIWLMAIICVILIIVVLYKNVFKDKNSNTKRKVIKYDKINKYLKIAIIVVLFFINLRPMIPNGETTQINSDLRILFVIDTSVSMRALDYDGNKPRLEGVINDCCYIVDELSNCKFSIITFGDSAERVIPFTSDTEMVKTELKCINLEDDFYAKGSSMNIVRKEFEKTLENEQKRLNNDSKFVVFFVSDGEITKEGESLKSFSSIKKYICNGAVMGYGTEEGGKMENSRYGGQYSDDNYYLYYYDNNYKKVTSISKIDENNLKDIASDLGVDYIKMNKTSDLNTKIKNIKQQATVAQTDEEKAKVYKDTYYYFAIILVILMIADFVVQKRRMI